MLPKVLIGYDDSPQGDDALWFGRSLSEVLDARPIVTTVIAHTRHGVEESDFDEAVTKFCEPLFDKARERIDAVEVTAKPMVNDSPAAGIYELTDWEKPTAVVIGSTRHGKSGRVQVGTLGGSLLSGVRCSVAVAPRGYADRRSGLGRIGVAVDGSSQSWRALSAAAYLAERANAPLAILSVMGPPHYVLGGLLSPLGPEEYREYKEKEWESVYEEASGRVPDGVAVRAAASPWRARRGPGRGGERSRPAPARLPGLWPGQGHPARQRLRPCHGRGPLPRHGGPPGRRSHPARGVAPDRRSRLGNSSRLSRGVGRRNCVPPETSSLRPAPRHH